jgi:superfamily I DNA and/or RNA helicase/very-short-patch-repair endonuclease
MKIKPELISNIIELLKRRPNLRAAVIASELCMDRKTVNQALYYTFKDIVAQNENYEWYLTTESEKVMKEQENDIPQLNKNFAFDSLQAIRNRLLDLTGRNRLLNFKHGRSGFIRVIDEMPDQLVENILNDEEFTFIPINEPLYKELIEHGYIKIDTDGQEIELKPYPSAKEWAKIKGFNTDYELPLSEDSQDTKHNDTNIQTLLYPADLEAKLRAIRSKANTAIEETGTNILYLAFGFLEWFEDENSDVVRQAPLFLIPVKVEKATLNKTLGTYTYTIQYTSEDIIPNLSLQEKLRHDFHISLPDIDEDTLPEKYFKTLENQILRRKPKWKLKRFATLAMFDFGKLLMYLDLDPERWPQGEKNIQNHAILKKFFAKEGSETGNNNPTSFGEEYSIDDLEEVHNKYPLIDDADSSQHSALVDAINGKDLVIEGPPGSGKSQTITNLIAAAIAQGKKVLFVAEKMAALQVVKSRLSRAGLGDFCLELHSHKTQKKFVYQDLAHRINRQNDYRYPSSIHIDIQMYEEKKEALTRYADLINSEWKKTNRTIHQIFTAATRYRDEFPDIRLEEIKPSHIDGGNFDEISSRRMTDNLKRYAMVYKEVKGQNGSSALLSDHPWFGIYNQSIQLYDCDEISELLDTWNKNLVVLKDATAPINVKFNTNQVDNVDAVVELIADKDKLPNLHGSERLDVLADISNETHLKLTEYVNLYKDSLNLFNALKELFELPSLINGEPLRNLIESNKYVNDTHKTDSLTLTNLFKQHKLLQSLRGLCLSLAEDVKVLIEQDNTLVPLVDNSHNGFSELNTYLQHITALDPMLISRRHEVFDNELLDKYLPELERLLPQIEPLYKSLNQHFNLDNLPTVVEINEVNNILQETSILSWLSSDWRSAKNKLLLHTKGLKPKVKFLAPLLKDLSKYKELVDEFNAEPAYQLSLQHEFNGIHTPIAELLQLRAWYKAVRASYGVGFGTRVGFANSLFSINADTFKGFKYLAESKTLNLFPQFDQLYLQLHEIYTTKFLSDKSLDLISDNSFSNFIDLLEQNIESLQSVCKKDFILSELPTHIQKIRELLKKEEELDSVSISKLVFGNDSYLAIRQDSSTNLNQIESTLFLLVSINKLDSNLLKAYLINSINIDTLQLLFSNLDLLETAFYSTKTAFDTFAKRVELDRKAWFSNTDDKLALIYERNEKAISQPKWLSTWVDFIRIRTNLSQKGLENLLRFTETGKINLENLEQVYLYSVFDTLSREIINENTELAHFSGADQNAIRQQFREYDEKLKKLQQEKVAYEVAHNGIKYTQSGVSSGKISNYTEMGLINKEINKKVRHIPIRQLVKRSGQSLIALKPCFMMGPHSVAQYLEPGQIEFDLVVMDEASQIKPEDALGTIARCKQLVVVGDPKQLPPTSFFDKTIESEEEDVTAIEQSESILDVSFPMFKARRLRWHYRSRHESLIAFSNQEFYDNNLVVFPSPSNKSDEFGIKFTHVKAGFFNNQCNIEEAKVIAEAVRKHFLHRPKESLGVVAMNAKQREQIERCVEELSKDDTRFRDLLTENSYTDEPLFLKNLENVQGDERDVIYISCTYGPSHAGASQMAQRFGPINSAAGGRRLNVLFTRSKKRMHVFSSMTEGHIVATESSSPGVQALKSFLSYAQTGKLQHLQHTGKAPDSDFEISVMNALKLEGFNCVPQVGVAGYFIDLAVQDPGQPGRYLMGVECDGATYHSAKSARDRDRLRQSVLEGLGWNIKRIWSTDWFKNPQAQLKPIIEELHRLKTKTPVQSEAIDVIKDIDEVIEDESKTYCEHSVVIDEGKSLQEKLLDFSNKHILNDDNIPLANRILRPAMIDALCEFKPISKSEFLEMIPTYLRVATSKEHAKYLDTILNIIAEDESVDLL